MNIIFVDICSNNEPNDLGSKLLYKLFGFYFLEHNDKIKALYVNKDNYCKKILKLVLCLKYKQMKLYFVQSNRIQLDLKEIYSNSIEITEQNNLIQNDKLYIKNYIEKNNINLKDARILVVIDRFNDKEKEKINELINKYKYVDIYVNGLSDYFYVKDYIENLNNNLGSVIQILDKMTLMNYNILLVFSHKHEEWFTECSFVLNYNDSDLDIESNTYKLYLKHYKDLEIIFNKLKLDFKVFKKTKLGKLYIHKEWNALDK